MSFSPVGLRSPSADDCDAAELDVLNRVYDERSELLRRKLQLLQEINEKGVPTHYQGVLSQRSQKSSARRARSTSGGGAAAAAATGGTDSTPPVTPLLYHQTRDAGDRLKRKNQRLAQTIKRLSASPERKADSRGGGGGTAAAAERRALRASAGGGGPCRDFSPPAPMSDPASPPLGSGAGRRATVDYGDDVAAVAAAVSAVAVGYPAPPAPGPRPRARAAGSKRSPAQPQRLSDTAGLFFRDERGEDVARRHYREDATAAAGGAPVPAFPPPPAAAAAAPSGTDREGATLFTQSDAPQRSLVVAVLAPRPRAIDAYGELMRRSTDIAVIKGFLVPPGETRDELTRSVLPQLAQLNPDVCVVDVSDGLPVANTGGAVFPELLGAALPRCVSLCVAHGPQLDAQVLTEGGASLILRPPLTHDTFPRLLRSLSFEDIRADATRRQQRRSAAATATLPRQPQARNAAKVAAAAAPASWEAEALPLGRRATFPVDPVSVYRGGGDAGGSGNGLRSPPVRTPPPPPPSPPQRQQQSFGVHTPGAGAVPVTLPPMEEYLQARSTTTRRGDPVDVSYKELVV